MTFFRASFGIITRSNGGSALRRSAYQRCGNDGSGLNFASKAAELVSHGIIQPAGSRTYDGPQAMWGAAEACENRVDSQLARTLEIAIPHDLRDEFAVYMLGWLSNDHGFAVEWSRHSPPHVFGDGKDTKNDHIHALISLRKLNTDGFDRLKDRSFNNLMRKRGGRQMREAIAERMNAFFGTHGIAAKVTADPKTNDAYRIEEAPKQVIQEIKRLQQEAQKNGTIPKKISARTRDFIQQRHSRKNAIKAVARASREVRQTSISQSRDNADSQGPAAPVRPSERPRRETAEHPEPASSAIGADASNRPNRRAGRASRGDHAAHSNGRGSTERQGGLYRGQLHRIATNLQANRAVIRRNLSTAASAAVAGFRNAMAAIAQTTPMQTEGGAMSLGDPDGWLANLNAANRALRR